MVHHQVSNLRRDSHSLSCIEEEVAPGDFGLYSSNTTTQGGGLSQEGHCWHWNGRLSVALTLGEKAGSQEGDGRVHLGKR